MGTLIKCLTSNTQQQSKGRDYLSLVKLPTAEVYAILAMSIFLSLDRRVVCFTDGGNETVIVPLPYWNAAKPWRTDRKGNLLTNFWVFTCKECDWNHQDPSYQSYHEDFASVNPTSLVFTGCLCMQFSWNIKSLLHIIFLFLGLKNLYPISPLSHRKIYLHDFGSSLLCSSLRMCTKAS